MIQTHIEGWILEAWKICSLILTLPEINKLKMLQLPQHTVMRRLREVGRLEWMCYLKSEYPLQDYTVQNSSGNTLFIKAMWNVLVRAPASLRSEQVRGRKARGPQTEETGCKCQTFLFIYLLSGRRKQTTSVRFFSPSLYKIKKRFLLKFCIAMTTPGST